MSVSNSLADVVRFQSDLIAQHCTPGRTRTLCEFWGFDAAFACVVGWNKHSKAMTYLQNVMRSVLFASWIYQVNEMLRDGSNSSQRFHCNGMRFGPI